MDLAWIPTSAWEAEPPIRDCPVRWGSTQKKKLKRMDPRQIFRKSSRPAVPHCFVATPWPPRSCRGGLAPADVVFGAQGSCSTQACCPTSRLEMSLASPKQRMAHAGPKLAQLPFSNVPHRQDKNTGQYVYLGVSSAGSRAGEVGKVDTWAAAWTVLDVRTCRLPLSSSSRS